MKIAVIGGGPGGLYFSILTKKARPDWSIEVFERNRADDSFGFGVVFSDETLNEFLTRDEASYQLIRSRFAYWDVLTVARDGEEMQVSGNGFCGCSRKTLLQLLHQRCREEGVILHFESEITGLGISERYDLVVACDGIASQFRAQLSEKFGTSVMLHRNRFVWLGSTRPLQTFTYFFRNTVHGPMVAHTYQYEKGMSTWIFECSQETWEKFGFSIDNENDTIQKLSEIYKEELQGHPLINNRSHWRQFPEVTNQHWHTGNIVLLGDAKATAHFSIGSGTKLAMECAIALSDAVAANENDLPKAFETYEKQRRSRVEATQHAARISLDWFEHMDRHVRHPFCRFAFSVMTRAKKVTYENLRIRDSSFTDKVVKEYNALNGNAGGQLPAAFLSLKLRDLELDNRIVMSPMGQYAAVNGLVTDWHLVHYGSRAVGGVGLIITEMTAVAAEGRITEGCTGIYTDEQVAAWRKITEFIHSTGNAKIGIQLGHSGRKGSVMRPWEGRQQPLANGWDLVSASPLPFHEGGKMPQEITEENMELIISQFRQATMNADRAGFDLAELQAHHGFLLASFLSPLTNKRTDAYGGTVQNRLKFPLKVFHAIREVFPAGKPMSVRISADDWVPGGISEEEVMIIAQAFKDAGADVINVSTGNTVPEQKPVIGRMWQTPYADAVRNSVGIPVIATGMIQDIDQVNTILLNGRADLVALGRPLLMDPYFTRHAQAREGVEAHDLPLQYTSAWPLHAALKSGEKQELEEMKKALKPESHQIGKEGNL